MASTGQYIGHHAVVRTVSVMVARSTVESPCSTAVRATLIATTLEVTRRSAFEGNSEAPGEASVA